MLPGMPRLMPRGACRAWQDPSPEALHKEGAVDWLKKLLDESKVLLERRDNPLKAVGLLDQFERAIQCTRRRDFTTEIQLTAEFSRSSFHIWTYYLFCVFLT